MDARLTCQSGKVPTRDDYSADTRSLVKLKPNMERGIYVRLCFVRDAETAAISDETANYGHVLMSLNKGT